MTEPTLRFEVDPGVTTTVLRIYGEIDLFTSPVLRNQLNLVVQTSTCNIVLDLSEVRYVDSVGVSTILRTWKQLSQQDRELWLLNATPNIQRVFHALKLEFLLSAGGTSQTG